MCGAHPEVMRKLIETNYEKTTGYGSDKYTREAEEIILRKCGIDEKEGAVTLLEGGTQTNLLVVTRLLDYCEGVLASEESHINVHEAGAIEAAGHKVITLSGKDGKISAKSVDEYMRNYTADDTRYHIVKPGMVYITHPTEIGTLYSLAELEALSAVCRRWSLPLYLDGARLAYGLAASRDVNLRDIARLCDVFYIGGTKCGALFGEAVVTTRKELLPSFFSLCKQRGAVLSKGRILGVQFKALFEGDLYERIGRHAIEMAMMLKEGFTKMGGRMYIDSPTNQQFFVLPNSKIEALRKDVQFELWGPLREGETPVRFVTDWSTTKADVDGLLERFL